MMSFVKKYAAAIVLALFIAVLAVCDPFVPFRDFSEMENRNLSQRPAFSWTSFIEGRWTTKYEDYVNDQFIGRDLWITAKSVLESVMLKIENNGVAYGADGYMFEKYQSFNQQRFERNASTVADFAGRYGKRVGFMLIPNNYEILSDKVPAGLENIGQSAFIEAAYRTAEASGNVTAMNIVEPLKAASGEYIFYRTDHHWTTRGALTGYEAICRALSLEPLDVSKYPALEVPDFYGTLYSKTKYWNTLPDVITWYDIPIVGLTADGNEHTVLNDTAKFERRDKYGALLWGNNGVTEIKSAIADGEAAEKSILIIKDSYAHSLAGFLTANYGEVWLLDLRYYNGSVSEFIEANGIDDVLILYNFMNFASDADFAKLVS